MANEALEEDEGFSKEVIRFLDKNVGTEKSSATVVYSLLQDALQKKNCLETEVRDFERGIWIYAKLYFTCRPEPCL